MVCSYYEVEVHDFNGEELVRSRCYSFDEAFWQIQNYRDQFLTAYSFKIKYPKDQYIDEMKRIEGI